MTSTKGQRREAEPPRTLIKEGDPVRVTRQCRGKVPHPKRKQALTALNMHRASHPEDPRPMQAYRCAECGQWHIGHGRAA